MIYLYRKRFNDLDRGIDHNEVLKMCVCVPLQQRTTSTNFVNSRNDKYLVFDDIYKDYLN